jgi:hypothetical protein
MTALRARDPFSQETSRGRGESGLEWGPRRRRAARGAPPSGRRRPRPVGNPLLTPHTLRGSSSPRARVPPGRRIPRGPLRWLESSRRRVRMARTLRGERETRKEGLSRSGRLVPRRTRRISRALHRSQIRGIVLEACRHGCLENQRLPAPHVPHHLSLSGASVQFPAPPGSCTWPRLTIVCEGRVAEDLRHPECLSSTLYPCRRCTCLVCGNGAGAVSHARMQGHCRCSTPSIRPPTHAILATLRDPALHCATLSTMGPDPRDTSDTSDTARHCATLSTMGPGPTRY